MLEIIYWWSMETIFIYLLFWFIYDKWFWWQGEKRNMLAVFHYHNGKTVVYRIPNPHRDVYRLPIKINKVSFYHIESVPPDKIQMSYTTGWEQ